jgi:hypothetical protein
MEDNGVPAEITENHLDGAKQNILIGCHLLSPEIIPQIPNDTIVLNTEQIGDQHATQNDRCVAFLKRFRAWDYSATNIVRLRDYGIYSVEHLRIGYHAKLERIFSTERKEIDILFYGSMTVPRQNIINSLQKSGAHVVALFGVYGAERDRHIAKSKLVLNLHQKTSQIFEVIRCHYLMNNAKAIVCQWDEGTTGDDCYAEGLLKAPYERLVSTCLEVLSREEVRKEYEEKSLAALRSLDAVTIMRDLLGTL